MGSTDVSKVGRAFCAHSLSSLAHRHAFAHARTRNSMQRRRAHSCGGRRERIAQVTGEVTFSTTANSERRTTAYHGEGRFFAEARLQHCAPSFVESMSELPLRRRSLTDVRDRICIYSCTC